MCSQSGRSLAIALLFTDDLIGSEARQDVLDRIILRGQDVIHHAERGGDFGTRPVRQQGGFRVSQDDDESIAFARDFVEAPYVGSDDRIEVADDGAQLSPAADGSIQRYDLCSCVQSSI